VKSRIFIRMLLVILAINLSSAAERSEIPNAISGKTKVLVITGGHGFVQAPFFQVFKENLEIALTRAAHNTTNATAFERDDLLTYDVVLLYDMPKTITDSQKAKFLSILEKGIGLFVLHHAFVSYQHWPEYERIIGGRYP